MVLLSQGPCLCRRIAGLTWLLRAHKSAEAKVTRTPYAIGWDQHSIISATFCWLQQVTGQPRSRGQDQIRVCIQDCTRQLYSVLHNGAAGKLREQDLSCLVLLVLCTWPSLGNPRNR